MSEDREARLKRLERVYVRNPIYFVTCCTARRAKILVNDDVHAALREFAFCGQERGVYLGRYVVMPDHVHFFVRFGPTYSTQSLRVGLAALSLWMKSLKNALSKALNKQGISAPHWQKGFFDHVLRSDESYHEKWLYAAENPVRHGLVAHRDQWRFAGEICIFGGTEFERL